MDYESTETNDLQFLAGVGTMTNVRNRTANQGGWYG